MDPTPHAITDSRQAWKLLESDYTLRLSLVANEWAAEHLKAWNAVFAEGRRRGNAGYYGHALVEMEIADASKRAEWSYETCCEIWEIQGRSKCRAFFRAIFDWCLQPMFATREGCFSHEIKLHLKRTGLKAASNFSRSGGYLKREMGKLRAKWNTKLEIATRDADNEERLKREREREQKSQEIRDIRERSFAERAFAPLPSSALIGEHPYDGAVSPLFTWRELEIRFRDLHAKTSEQRVSANYVRTEWNSGSITEELILGGNAVWRAEFETLSSIAARKLGWTQSEDANNHWLDCVREWMQQARMDKDKNVAWLPTGTTVESGRSGITQGLYTEKIAELSSMFCTRLIARGTPESSDPRSPENAGIAKHRRSPRPILRKARRTRKQLHRTAVIFGAIQGGLKGQKYCAALDHRRVQPPEY